MVSANLRIKDDGMAIFPMILIRAGGLPFQPNEFKDGLHSELEHAAEEAADKVQAAFDALIARQPESTFRTALYNARKVFYQKQKMPNETLLGELDSRRHEPLTVELLANLKAWSIAAHWTQHYELAYQRRLEGEWASLQQTATDPGFRRALLFASHDLLDRLPEFCAKPIAAFNKKDRQTAVSIFQYRCRSTFKTSPLGRFTTVQLWRLGQEQDFSFEAEKVAITPNVAMLPALYEVLLRNPSFYGSLFVALNPSLSINEGADKPLTWLYFDGEHEAFQQLEPNPVAELIVQILLENDRKLPYPKLLGNLLEVVDAQQAPLETLLRSLIDLGLLAWQLPETGMTPSWSSNLVQYLSQLPSDPGLTDTAYLLQLLRVSARAIPYQSLEAAQQTQQESKGHLAAFFEKNAAVAPPIPAEQIFFEDVERTLPNNCPEAVIRQFADELSACWGSRQEIVLPRFRSRLYQFAKDKLQIGETIDFQRFCSLFFEDKTPEKATSAPRYEGKLGAMLQVYQTPSGYKAVVNAMFPGGGKLFARWLHLFPSDFKESLESPPILFPWQGWSNANFQSIQAEQTLLVPDGRVGGKRGKNTVLLSDLGVCLKADGPVLVEKSSGKPIVLTDLGLEAPESRPPVMQVLWHLGVPYVSSLALMDQVSAWTQFSETVNKRPRIEFQSLVLAREAWDLKVVFFEAAMAAPRKSAIRYRLLKKGLDALNVPRYFFARSQKQREKPQYFDQESPVSMLVFEKMLELGGDSNAFIEEMLPTPDQWVMGDMGHVGEFVVEF